MSKIFLIFIVIFFIIFTITIIFTIFNFSMIFNPKSRNKWFSKQIKATRSLIEETKDDIKDISTNMADASSDAIEIKARALKKGLTGNDEYMYCKYCGSKIDEDSKFCKKCGAEQ